MKRSLVAATAVALLLTGCATGDTGHLDPEIEPELVGPRSTAEPDAGSGSGGDGGAGEGAAPGAAGAASNDVEEAFADGAGSQAWYGEVTGVDVAGDDVVVSTQLTQAGDDAVAVCEAAVDAAESTGIGDPTVEVRGTEGTTLSERAAGDEGCSR